MTKLNDSQTAELHLMLLAVADVRELLEVEPPQPETTTLIKAGVDAIGTGLGMFIAEFGSDAGIGLVKEFLNKVERGEEP